jgi:hypothetical protein
MQRNSARAVGLVILICTAAATITALYSTRLMVRLTGGSATDGVWPTATPGPPEAGAGCRQHYPADVAGII